MELIGFVSQVLRWSALAFGVVYGFSHQRTITATQKAQHDQHEWEHKQKAIDQAKAEYAKKKNPAPASDDGMLRPDPLHLSPFGLRGQSQPTAPAMVTRTVS